MSDLGTLLAVALSSSPATLDAIWQATRKPGDAAAMSSAEYARVQAAAERVVVAARRGRLEDGLAAADALDGYTVTRIDVGDRPALVLAGGGGVFVLRVGRVDADVILQAPHRYFDLRSGDIARHAFAGAGLRGLFFNTVHREQRHGDAAHSVRSAFSAVTEACVAALDQPTFVQLHGFDRAHLDVDAVVSAGATPSDWSRDRVALALVAQGATVARFPEEVDELGGTINQQGKRVAGSDAHFVHVEMSAALRERMRDRERARALGVALARLAKKESG